MSDPKSFFLSKPVHEYLVAHGAPPDEVQQWLIQETLAKVPDLSMMQISPEQGAFMTLLARLIQAKHAIEIGTFTGYSSLAIAYGLESDGHLLCCDVSEEWTAIAREGWERAGMTDRIELQIAPALETLQALPKDALIDLAFIDADKQNYAAYYEELIIRMRTNGVILVDNVLWSGTVADPSVADADTNAIREFNDMVAADARVDASMIPLGDGLTLLRKR
ncbi:MAG: SAM-dependent methyltransferase [Acidimicrobiia bacterium]|nr:SAM-dependent methyltransferase [Acidimicrobiia bacterium]